MRRVGLEHRPAVRRSQRLVVGHDDEPRAPCLGGVADVCGLDEEVPGMLTRRGRSEHDRVGSGHDLGHPDGVAGVADIGPRRDRGQHDPRALAATVHGEDVVPLGGEQGHDALPDPTRPADHHRPHPRAAFTRAAYTPALGFGVRANVSRSTSCRP